MRFEESRQIKLYLGMDKKDSLSAKAQQIFDDAVEVWNRANDGELPDEVLFLIALRILDKCPEPAAKRPERPKPATNANQPAGTP